MNFLTRGKSRPFCLKSTLTHVVVSRELCGHKAVTSYLLWCDGRKFASLGEFAMRRAVLVERLAGLLCPLVNAIALKREVLSRLTIVCKLF